jgi:hypothetical protein
MKKALVGVAVALAACGGGKGADSPGTCPDGTVLKGSDCVPADSAGDTSSSSTSSSDSAPKKRAAKSSDDDSSAAGGGGDSTASAGSGAPYDKDEVEAKMRRSAKQIKANCGSATDDDGKASGPWGTVHATIVLGRNGHVKDVTVPDPYNGKPVGACVARQLQKLIYPPYAGSSDSSIEWDFELVKPK